MAAKPTPKRYPVPAPYPDLDHFEYFPPRARAEIEKNPALTTAAFWKSRCQCLFYAGATLSLWNEANEMKFAFLSACDIRETQNIMVIGKYAEESGLAPALESLLGREGQLKVVEIGQQAIDSLLKPDPKTRIKLQWDFNYLDTVPDKSLDRIILFSAASHIANLKHFAVQVHRTLKDGGRLIIGETPLGGNQFHHALHLDAHDEGYILRVLSCIGIREEELPDTNPEDLADVFQPFLRWHRFFNWGGVYLFYGQKNGTDKAASPSLPRMTANVRKFLTPKPSDDSWDFISKAEQAAFSEGLKVTLSHERARSWGTSNIMWAWFNHRNVTDVMYSNLMLEPGDKIMVICESMVPDALAIESEIQRRTGGKVEIEWVIMSPGGYDYDGWQKKRAEWDRIGTGEEWEYDFADRFPDKYFDLIFLPQGVHHSNNWLRDAPRLLRTLKPGRQFIAIECGVNRPEHLAGYEMSALVRFLGDRIWKWVAYPSSLYHLSSKRPLPPPPEAKHVGRPFHDVPAAHLRQAFGNALYDVYSLEQSGFLLFWGYKKEERVL